jgi:hypothetical protein
VNDPGWDKMQFKDPASHCDSVTGIIATVITGGESSLSGKPIHNATFALIPPLCTNDHLQGHSSPSHLCDQDI